VKFECPHIDHAEVYRVGVGAAVALEASRSLETAPLKGQATPRASRIRRTARLLPLTAVAALACSIAASGAATHPAAAPALVVDNSFALDTSDPQRAFDPTSTIVDRAVYDTLFTYAGNDLTHPVPSLVRSWTSAKAKAFTFRLRRDAHFADGTPLTSADVVFSLRRLGNLKGNPAHVFAGMRASAKDKYTVVIESATPVPQLPAILTNSATGIVNSELVRAHGGTDAADASTADKAEGWFNSPASAGAGSGPYVLQSYSPTSQVTLRANGNYWGARKPAFGTVVIRNMSAPIQLINIRRGSHQIAIDISSDQAQTLTGDGALRVTRQPSPWVFYMFTNDDPQVSAVTSNTRFQQAVRNALDYKGLVALAGRGALQATGLIPSMIAGELPQTEAPNQDLAKAKEDLATSGVGTQRVTLEYPSDLTINGVPFATLAQKIQANLQSAGFDVSLAGSPVATFQPKFRAGHVAFGIWLYAFDYPDPAGYLVFTPGSLIALHAGWRADPPIEKLVAKALVETAPSARRSLYQRIQREVNARGPFIPLIQPTQVFVTTSDLRGAAFSAAYDVDLTQVSPK
jgi:peptide/nickel transport system substrate-binding protein